MKDTDKGEKQGKVRLIVYTYSQKRQGGIV